MMTPDIQRVKELISCRNEFVHPKPRGADFFSDGEKDRIIKEETASRKYPKYLNFISLEDSINGIGDVANFTGWVLYDICKMKVEDGASMIGFGTYGWTASQDEICRKKSIDQRSFGVESLS